MGVQIKDFDNGKFNLGYLETGDGPAMHFFHANGFTAGVYRPIFSALSNEYRVLGLNYCSDTRCLMSCEVGAGRINSWHSLADDFIQFLTECVQQPVIAVGHSLGGVVSTLASIKRPDLFRALILLDPVFQKPKIIRIIRVAVMTGQRSRFPLAVRARKRRNGWASRDEAREYFAKRSLFEGWSDSAMDAYMEYGLMDDGAGGVRLTCPPEIEAQGFESYPVEIWKSIRSIKKPAVIIRGEKSDVLTDASWNNFGRVRPDIERITLPGCGHLFPMQQPEKAIELIRKYAKELTE